MSYEKDIWAELSQIQSKGVGGWFPNGTFSFDLVVARAFADDPNVVVRLLDESFAPMWGVSLRDTGKVAWLPRGRYVLTTGSIPRTLRLAAAHVEVEVRRRIKGQSETVSIDRWPVAIPDPAEGANSIAGGGGLTLASRAGTTAVEDLSWNRTHSDWFHRHFDHAARTVAGYLLADHPLLQGRILDVGCGDGITDLAIALHCEPELLIGIDPFGGFNNLPRIIAENHLPGDVVPSCLQFAVEDGNKLPYPDNDFDVVLSWGSLEHIAGGYAPCLSEIRRVLRDGGLFFAHPGLYYSNYGHHLSEFSDEPFLHLRRSPEELRELVFSKEPTRIDRSGDDATPEQYWQWYLELNKITVAGFERELRDLGFEPWRVALRTEDMIEYTPEVLHYSMQDLATAELYSSWWNRKPQRT